MTMVLIVMPKPHQQGENTARHRPTSSIAASLAEPNASPSLSRFTVMALSIITCDGHGRVLVELIGLNHQGGP